MPVLTPDKQFYDPAETVLVARELGHVDVSSSTVKNAAYYGEKPLKRTKIAAVSTSPDRTSRRGSLAASNEPTEPDEEGGEA